MAIHIAARAGQSLKTNQKPNYYMKSITTLLLAIAMLFVVPTMTFAKKDKGGSAGKVTSVDDKSITISSKKSGGSTTFKIDENTKISVDGQDGKKASDITVGMKASVTAGSAADTAASITATAGKGKKKNK
jgi:hypothetical protein